MFSRGWNKNGRQFQLSPSGFVLVFCLLKVKHFVMLHKRFFHQIKKQEEMTLYLPEPTLSGSFVCYNFMHYLSRKFSCSILTQKFQNYSSWTVPLALYMSLFFCGLWQKPTFQIIYKHPLSRSLLNRCLILWDWTSDHKIFTNVIQSLI